jgi:hypothetical protein
MSVIMLVFLATLRIFFVPLYFGYISPGIISYRRIYHVHAVVIV